MRASSSSIYRVDASKTFRANPSLIVYAVFVTCIVTFLVLFGHFYDGLSTERTLAIVLIILAAFISCFAPIYISATPLNRADICQQMRCGFCSCTRIFRVSCNQLTMTWMLFAVLFCVTLNVGTFRALFSPDTNIPDYYVTWLVPAAVAIDILVFLFMACWMPTNCGEGRCGMCFPQEYRKMPTRQASEFLDQSGSLGGAAIDLEKRSVADAAMV